MGSKLLARLQSLGLRKSSRKKTSSPLGADDVQDSDSIEDEGIVLSAKRFKVHKETKTKFEKDPIQTSDFKRSRGRTTTSIDENNGGNNNAYNRHHARESDVKVPFITLQQNKSCVSFPDYGGPEDLLGAVQVPIPGRVNDKNEVSKLTTDDISSKKMASRFQGGPRPVNRLNHPMAPSNSKRSSSAAFDLHSAVSGRVDLRLNKKTKYSNSIQTDYYNCSSDDEVVEVDVKAQKSDNPSPKAQHKNKRPIEIDYDEKKTPFKKQKTIHTQGPVQPEMISKINHNSRRPISIDGDEDKATPKKQKSFVQPKTIQPTFFQNESSFRFRDLFTRDGYLINPKDQADYQLKVEGHSLSLYHMSGVLVHQMPIKSITEVFSLPTNSRVVIHKPGDESFGGSDTLFIEFQTHPQANDFVKMLRNRSPRICFKTQESESRSYISRVWDNSKPKSGKTNSTIPGSTSNKTVASSSVAAAPSKSSKTDSSKTKVKPYSHVSTISDSESEGIQSVKFIKTKPNMKLNHETRSTRQSPHGYLDRLTARDPVVYSDAQATGWTTTNEGWSQCWTQPVIFPPNDKKQATVDRDDVPKLDELEWLNDNLINFYLRWLEHHLQITNPALAKRIYFQNTYFYHALTKKHKTKKGIDYEAVGRWTRKVDLLSFDYIIVPVNEGLHWYLAIICNAPKLLDPNFDVKRSRADNMSPKIITLDSLDAGHPSTCSNLIDYLVAETKNKRGIDIVPPSPMGVKGISLYKQENLSDCGVFLLTYVEKFLESPSNFLDAVLHKDSEFRITCRTAKDTRTHIRNILFALQQEQQIPGGQKAQISPTSVESMSSDSKAPAKVSSESIPKEASVASNDEDPNQVKRQSATDSMGSISLESALSLPASSNLEEDPEFKDSGLSRMEINVIKLRRYFLSEEYKKFYGHSPERVDDPAEASDGDSKKDGSDRLEGSDIFTDSDPYTDFEPSSSSNMPQNPRDTHINAVEESNSIDTRPQSSASALSDVLVKQQAISGNNSLLDLDPLANPDVTLLDPPEHSASKFKAKPSPRRKNRQMASTKFIMKDGKNKSSSSSSSGYGKWHIKHKQHGHKKKEDEKQ